MLYSLLQHLRYAWVFADSDFSASGNTWDGLNYRLQRSSPNNGKLLNLTVTGVSQTNGTVFIIQIAGPWEQEGKLELTV